MYAYTPAVAPIEPTTQELALEHQLPLTHEQFDRQQQMTAMLHQAQPPIQAPQAPFVPAQKPHVLRPSPPVEASINIFRTSDNEKSKEEKRIYKCGMNVTNYK